MVRVAICGASGYTALELIKILLKFIKTGQKRDQLLLVSRLLEQNVPAGFIVSLLLKIGRASCRERVYVLV